MLACLTFVAAPWWSLAYAMPAISFRAWLALGYDC